MAVSLMQSAVALLDAAGETAAAARLREAIDMAERDGGDRREAAEFVAAA